MTSRPSHSAVARPATARSPLAGERAEQVLDAAATVFARQGYEGTSIDDIADELGATKGRVYHYYRSKADLLLDVLRLGAQTLIDVVRPLAQDAGAAPDERLLAMARAHASMMMSHHAYQYVSLLSFGQPSFEDHPVRHAQWTTVRALRAEYEQLFDDVVEAGCRSGVFATEDVRVMVRGLLGSLNWITVWYRPDHADPRVVADQIADALARFAVSGARGQPRPSPGCPDAGSGAREPGSAAPGRGLGSTA